MLDSKLIPFEKRHLWNAVATLTACIISNFSLYSLTLFCIYPIFTLAKKYHKSLNGIDSVIDCLKINKFSNKIFQKNCLRNLGKYFLRILRNFKKFEKFLTANSKFDTIVKLFDWVNSKILILIDWKDHLLYKEFQKN